MFIRIIFILMLTVVAPLVAYDGTPPCFKQLENNFFKDATVTLGLGYHQKIDQSDWHRISRKLQDQNPTVFSLMQERAKKMNPNPLEHPFNAKAAKKLLKEVTREIFMSTLSGLQVSESQVWENLFQFIYQKELKQLESCLSEK